MRQKIVGFGLWLISILLVLLIAPWALKQLSVLLFFILVFALIALPLGAFETFAGIGIIALLFGLFFWGFYPYVKKVLSMVFTFDGNTIAFGGTIPPYMLWFLLTIPLAFIVGIGCSRFTDNPLPIVVIVLVIWAIISAVSYSIIPDLDVFQWFGGSGTVPGSGGSSSSGTGTIPLVIE